MLVSQELVGHKTPVISIAWCHKANRILSASLDGSLIVWDAASGDRISRIEGNFGTMCCSPDGDQVASCGGDDDDEEEESTIILWDVGSGTQTAQLKGHTDEVNSLAWSPTDNRIASASKDRTVLVWSASTGEARGARRRRHERRLEP